MKSTVDRNGNSVKEGDRVIVVSVHPSVVDPLPVREKEKVISMVGRSLRVHQVDEYGQAWVEMAWETAPGKIESHSLGLASEEMELVLK